MLISVVVDTTITAGSSDGADVDIGVSLPLYKGTEGIKGIVAVQSGGVHQPPENYTVSVIDDDTVHIAVPGGTTNLTDGDIVNIAVICRGEIARP